MSNGLSELFFKKKKCPKGQILIRPNEEPSGVYYIHRGYVKAYDITSEGKNQLMAIYGPGEIIPLYWALGGERSYLFYQTMTDIEFDTMPRDVFIQKYEADKLLLKDILGLLLRSYRFIQQRVQNLEYPTAVERLAFRLLFLGKYFGHKVSSEIHIEVQVTHQDTADALNMTRDTANRAALKLIKQGLIVWQGKKIIIKAPEKLMNIIGEGTTLNY